ncbi:MAG TPA: hypothetical protein VGT03_12155 [Candidatus Acidoferrales bacterium]|nr:hypothetical protein [Candidatus Acidoferrales bacterium]
MACVISAVLRSLSVALTLVLGFALPVNARRSNGNERIHLVPRYQAGQVLRYNIQLRTETTSNATGPILDPEGATEFKQSVGVVLRLEVLSVAGTEAGPVSLRATYEKVAVSSKSNSYDPDAAALEQQYQKLEGRSMEFTLLPDGEIADVKGLAEVATDPSRAIEVNQWLSQLTLGAAAPRKGIAIGEKWSSEHAVDNAPIAGVEWHMESIYQNNEPCTVSGSAASTNSETVPPSAPARTSGECAIILTRSETRNSNGGQDRTPAAYKENGLRTSGEWKGTGETLTAISLRTGMVVSVTQTGTTQMDFTVTAAASGGHIRYSGEVHSQSQITLLSQTKIP